MGGLPLAWIYAPRNRQRDNERRSRREDASPDIRHELVVLCWSEAIDAHTLWGVSSHKLVESPRIRIRYLVGLAFFGAGALESKELVDQCIPDQLHFCKHDHSGVVGLQDWPHKGSVLYVFECGKVHTRYQSLNLILY